MTTTEEQPREAMAAQIEALAKAAAELSWAQRNSTIEVQHCEEAWAALDTALKSAPAIVTALRQAEAAAGVAEEIARIIDPLSWSHLDDIRNRKECGYGVQDMMPEQQFEHVDSLGQLTVSLAKARAAFTLARQHTASPPIEVERTVADGAREPWRAIESAPSELPIDIWYAPPGKVPCRVPSAYFDESGRWYDSRDIRIWHPEHVTHWMPLPAAPTTDADDAVIAEFAFLYREYGLEDDEKLAPDALELKRKVLDAIALSATPAPSDEVVRLRGIAQRLVAFFGSHEAFGDEATLTRTAGLLMPIVQDARAALGPEVGEG